jgi:hypothetical protein
VAEIRGLRSQLLAGSAEESPDRLLYAYEWRLQPRPAAEGDRTHGDWLLFADRSGVAERLAERLQAS